MPTDLPPTPPPPLGWRAWFWLRVGWGTRWYRVRLKWTCRKAQRAVAKWERDQRTRP
jgi:hypothetical protein